MKINVVKLLLCVIPVSLLLVFQASSATDTPSRVLLERQYFSEYLIKATLYAKNSHDVYNHEERKFVHGLPRLLLPYLYEPDVYTWDLARSAFRTQLQGIDPSQIKELPKDMQPGYSSMSGVSNQPQLTPLIPADPNDVNKMRQDMVTQMNTPAAEAPNVPVLPTKLPKGKRGDSFDSSY
ncbi:MAG: hypothetical protein HQM10_08780 [Candidatus Riflebacteria bacterium]|nr:hypothetical protein [Candidatus Riflebacteria bacterium]